MKNRNIILAAITTTLFTSLAAAHCPLCTVGAATAAGGAVWLGVSKVVVALFIGAFSMSMGMWFAKIPKKQYMKFQKPLILIVVFLATLLPILPVVKAIGPLYISFVGEFGTTYAINYSMTSSLIGALIVAISPITSKKLTNIRKGKKIRFQGMILTFALLIIAGTIIQLII